MSNKFKSGDHSISEAALNSTRSDENKRGKRIISPPQSLISTETEEGRSSSRSMSHIVVVDDEEYICEVIREMLSNEGYKIHTICDPQKALDFVRAHPIDLVLTDLIMGKKSGVDVLNQTTKFHRFLIFLFYKSVKTCDEVI